MRCFSLDDALDQRAKGSGDQRLGDADHIDAALGAEDGLVAGKGLFPIAKELNDLGIRTHRGNRFENRTVEYILRNRCRRVAWCR